LNCDCRTIFEFYPLRQLRLGSCRKLGEEFKVDLAPKRVDASDFDPDVLTQAELAAVVAVFDEVFLLVVVVVVVGEESEVQRMRTATRC